MKFLGGILVPDYKKMYLHLFNAVTDTLTELGRFDYGGATARLKQAQVDCEAFYLQEK